MRHSDQGGRFDIPYEHHEIFRGIDGDLRAGVGATVHLVVFDAEDSITDDIYDVGGSALGTGRRWNTPVRLPAYSAVIVQGPSQHNDRGFYNTDALRVSVAMDIMEELFPDIAWSPDMHTKDRLLYRGEVFVPTRTSLRGQLRDTHTMVTIDANQVNPEEYVNDPDLLAWVHRYDDNLPAPYSPQRSRGRITL